MARSEDLLVEEEHAQLRQPNSWDADELKDPKSL